MAINIFIPQSGVVAIQQDANPSRYYFGIAGAAGKWYVSGKDYDGITYNQILLIIGGDSYQLFWTDTEVSGVAPTSLSDLNDLLTNLFSTL